MRLVWVVLLAALFSCGSDTTIIQNNQSQLVYSGTYLIGAHKLFWPAGQTGMLLFNVVRNISDTTWEGTPKAAVYDTKTLLKISEGNGVITARVNKHAMVPEKPYLKRIPANTEVESLIYLNVDFDKHPLVYVYWQFAPLGTQVVFPDSVSNAIPFEVFKRNF